MTAPYKLDKADVQQFYIDGFNSGIDWPDRWYHLPGGPYVLSPGHSQQADWVAYCERTQRRYLAWKWGWKHGATARNFALAPNMRVENLSQAEWDRTLVHVLRSDSEHKFVMSDFLIEAKGSKDPVASADRKAILVKVANLKRELLALEAMLS